MRKISLNHQRNITLGRRWQDIRLENGKYFSFLTLVVEYRFTAVIQTMKANMLPKQMISWSTKIMSGKITFTVTIVKENKENILSVNLWIVNDLLDRQTLTSVQLIYVCFRSIKKKARTPEEVLINIELNLRNNGRVGISFLKFQTKKQIIFSDYALLSMQFFLCTIFFILKLTQ